MERAVLADEGVCETRQQALGRLVSGGVLAQELEGVEAESGHAGQLCYVIVE